MESLVSLAASFGETSIRDVLGRLFTGPRSHGQSTPVAVDAAAIFVGVELRWCWWTLPCFLLYARCGLSVERLQ
jgi:hypothetical protein